MGRVGKSFQIRPPEWPGWVDRERPRETQSGVLQQITYRHQSDQRQVRVRRGQRRRGSVVAMASEA